MSIVVILCGIGGGLVFIIIVGFIIIKIKNNKN